MEICDGFARDNDIIYSTEKSVCMMIHPGARPGFSPPPIRLSGSELQYVKCFKYLGHIISADFKDDQDTAREIKSLNRRGNVIVRKFGFLSLDVKCELFRTYCYPMYTSALWVKYNQSSLGRLRVAYNNIMRRLAYVPTWESASHMFGTLGVRSFNESIRNSSYSLMKRIELCPNNFIASLSASDSALVSSQRRHWRQVLY